MRNHPRRPREDGRTPVGRNASTNAPKSRSHVSQATREEAADPKNAGPGLKASKNIVLFKTEMCRNFVKTGECQFGDDCHFAHGGDQLRAVDSHPKHKTSKCKFYFEKGVCPYGPKCHFLHESSEVSSAGEQRDPSPVREESPLPTRAEYTRNRRHSSDDLQVSEQYMRWLDSIEDTKLDTEGTGGEIIWTPKPMTHKPLEPQSPIGRRTHRKSRSDDFSSSGKFARWLQDSAAASSTATPESTPIQGLIDGLWSTSKFGSGLHWSEDPNLI